MANTENLGSKKMEQTTENENFVTKVLSFFNKYQNLIYGIIIGILVLVLAILAFNRFYLQKKNAEASAQIVQPIQWYMQGDTASLNMALEGDGENDGFLDIASSYKLTKTANTANYYAGLTYLKLGKKDEAMDYLKKFKQKEDVLWYACQATIGDLYDDQGDEANAISYYEKAAKGKDPLFTPIALFKLGQMYERKGDWNKALAAYETIEKDFYNEYNKMSVAQYTERARANASK
ncbi:MAG: tetratricopeptide repeat protein [Bacteroidales bacterium]|jgi:tetratricopeptide (TPR) repeat protein|nr:tetratricopeptide repeat protein [Bacteroidales bacterium]